MSASESEAGLLQLADKALDAIVLLGTGMPTLGSILRHPRAGNAVVLSEACSVSAGPRSMRRCAGNRIATR